ncbi:MAG: GPP34 family phosphoprotein [Acidimicrobiaceae bacterium]|nr:GPP34 family phosphoprotein [Acidimicrobiaceae bacterium]MYE96919.1 GPP34 family phosphoprotein [Acidimicrobiaceae bacterium]MYI54195.1 GPP34 family phosphoprotein [Acidimicrobiaceae bacterium]
MRRRQETVLRFVEEVLLLLLRDDGGRFVAVPGIALDNALAGGVLMDLALENRIDTDPRHLILIDLAPVGDSILDPTLAAIAAGERRDARYWVAQTALRAAEIREEALSRLVERGILERHEGRFLWVFRSRRYPVIDGKAEREVKRRILGVLLSDDIPSPRDIAIIGLAEACGILRELMPKVDYARARQRIDQVRRLDLIGQATSQAIHDIEMWLAGRD